MKGKDKDKPAKQWCMVAVRDARFRGIHYLEGEHLHVHDKDTRKALLDCGAFAEIGEP